MTKLLERKEEERKARMTGAELVQMYAKEFSKPEENSSDKGILRGKLRKELHKDLERRLNEGPNYMKMPLNKL